MSYSGNISLTSISFLTLLLTVLLSPQPHLDSFNLKLHRARQYLRSHLPVIPFDEYATAQNDVNYTVQLFSRDPVILYINDFLTPLEVNHLLNLSESQYSPSKIFPGADRKDHVVDEESRVSSLSFFKRDAVYNRIAHRGMHIQGHRGQLAFFQPPYVQRYEVGGFYKEHHDWDPTYKEGNRITTFLVYLGDNCTGGGTNFPLLPRPKDRRWCNIIDCEDKGVEGVTFKPRVGAAIFWENMHPNGSFNLDVLHSSQPVTSGVKYALNMFTWDLTWRAPKAPEGSDS